MLTMLIIVVTMLIIVVAMTFAVVTMLIIVVTMLIIMVAMTFAVVAGLRPAHHDHNASLYPPNVPLCIVEISSQTTISQT